MANTSEMTLRWRGTFIDLDAPGADGPRRRTRSEEPASRGYGEDGEDATGKALEEAYVKELSAAWAAVTDAATAAALFGKKVHAKGSKADAADDSSAVSTAVPEDRASRSLCFEGSEVLGELPSGGGQRLLRPRRARHGRAPAAPGGANVSVAAFLMKAKGDAPAVAPATDAPSGTSWVDTELEDEDDSLWPTQAACGPGSRGSFGHPNLCSRPCMHVAGPTGCSRGTGCDFCHFEHGRRVPHLDKRQREVLRSFSPGEWASIILPILRKKIAGFDLSGAALVMLDELAELAGIPPLSSSDGAQRHQRMLVLTLRAMNLRTLIVTVQRSLASLGLPWEEACGRLLSYLRTLISET